MTMDTNAIDLLPADSLPDWLLPERLPGGAVITAMQPYTLRVTDVDQPTLIVPLRGKKMLMTEQVSATVGVGNYLMMHRSFKGTVRNLTEHGLYHAWCIGFPWRVVSLARTLLDAHSLPPAHGPAVGTGALAPLQPALQCLVTLPRTEEPQADAAALDHALAGLLLALARIGESQFRLAQDPTLASRIRLLFRAAPGRDWTSADVEDRLHMSGATLRRRLAAEHTSLRVLLRDVRLDHGLQQLQATRRSLKLVAQACGYRSVPSFSRQFAERFGVDPAIVAHGQA
jgi:AraC-like DNA-binding protein